MGSDDTEADFYQLRCKIFLRLFTSTDATSRAPAPREGDTAALLFMVSSPPSDRCSSHFLNSFQRLVSPSPTFPGSRPRLSSYPPLPLGAALFVGRNLRRGLLCRSQVLALFCVYTSLSLCLTEGPCRQSFPSHPPPPLRPSLWVSPLPLHPDCPQKSPYLLHTPKQRNNVLIFTCD